MTEPDPFREYHRAGFRTRAGRAITGVAIATALVVGVGMLAGAAPAPVAPPLAEATPPTTAPGLPAAPDSTAAPVTLPAPEASATPLAVPDVVEASAPASWSISVDTTGYQKEIDQCLWVRMDLGIPAPVVGAHNYCGGSVVLEMAVGDTVTLAGQGLDGQYRVSEERLARAGDIAADATAGLSAAVILQTCFWANDGSERLLALQRIP